MVLAGMLVDGGRGGCLQVIHPVGGCAKGDAVGTGGERPDFGDDDPGLDLVSRGLEI